jgi:broad specificity phosphatase PhoE
MAQTLVKGGVLSFITVVIAVLLAVPAAGENGRTDGLLTGQALLKALRGGGYTLYFRHAPTNWSQGDDVQQAGDWTSCDPDEMRQLSRQGRESARRIGRQIRRLGIPVGRVFSSEYCRARETARLMNLGEVAPTRKLMNMRVAEMVGGRGKVIDRARTLIADQPAPGTNTVLVAHGNLMRAATGTYADEGGAAVFEPRGGGRFALVARITPEQWAELAQQR